MDRRRVLFDRLDRPLFGVSRGVDRLGLLVDRLRDVVDRFPLVLDGGGLFPMRSRESVQGLLIFVEHGLELLERLVVHLDVDD